MSFYAASWPLFHLLSINSSPITNLQSCHPERETSCINAAGMKFWKVKAPGIQGSAYHSWDSWKKAAKEGRDENWISSQWLKVEKELAMADNAHVNWQAGDPRRIMIMMGGSPLSISAKQQPLLEAFTYLASFAILCSWGRVYSLISPGQTYIAMQLWFWTTVFFTASTRICSHLG